MAEVNTKRELLKADLRRKDNNQDTGAIVKEDVSKENESDFKEAVHAAAEETSSAYANSNTTQNHDASQAQNEQLNSQAMTSYLTTGSAQANDTTEKKSGFSLQSDNSSVSIMGPNQADSTAAQVLEVTRGMGAGGAKGQFDPVLNLFQKNKGVIDNTFAMTAGLVTNAQDVVKQTADAVAALKQPASNILNMANGLQAFAAYSSSQQAKNGADKVDFSNFDKGPFSAANLTKDPMNYSADKNFPGDQSYNLGALTSALQKFGKLQITGAGTDSASYSLVPADSPVYDYKNLDSDGKPVLLSNPGQQQIFIQAIKNMQIQLANNANQISPGTSTVQSSKDLGSSNLALDSDFSSILDVLNGTSATGTSAANSLASTINDAYTQLSSVTNAATNLDASTSAQLQAALTNYTSLVSLMASLAKIMQELWSKITSMLS